MIGTWMLSKSPQVKKCRHAPMWKTPQGTPWRPLAKQHHKSCIHCHKVIPFGPANDTPEVLMELEAIELAECALAVDFDEALQSAMEALEQINAFAAKLVGAASIIKEVEQQFQRTTNRRLDLKLQGVA